MPPQGEGLGASVSPNVRACVSICVCVQPWSGPRLPGILGAHLSTNLVSVGGTGHPRKLPGQPRVGSALVWGGGGMEQRRRGRKTERGDWAPPWPPFPSQLPNLQLGQHCPHSRRTVYRVSDPLRTVCPPLPASFPTPCPRSPRPTGDRNPHSSGTQGRVSSGESVGSLGGLCGDPAG